MKIALISCGKAKLTTKSRAEDLYTGQFFKINLVYAKKHYDIVYILSAKHNLLELSDIIELYDLTLKDKPKSYRQFWSIKTAKQLNAILKDEDELFVLAGKSYIEYVLPQINNKKTLLFQNMGMAYKMQAMRKEL